MSSFLPPRSSLTAQSIQTETAYASQWASRPTVADALLCSAGVILLGIVYWLTLAPTVFTLDSAEFATAAYALGIVHSPGYVVYLLIAHITTYLPVGDIAFRVNLLSAIFSLLAFVTIFYLLRTTTGRLAAWLAGIMLGFNYYVWSLSVVAEVYTMQMFLYLLLITIALRWYETKRPNLFYLLAFLSGLSIANNPATGLWAPGFFYLAWQGRKQLSLSTVSIAVGCGLIGLLPLLYLPLRASSDILFTNVGTYDASGSFTPASLSTWAGIRWYLTGQEFDALMFSYSPFEIIRESGLALNRLIAATLGIGFPIGIWGIHRMWRTRPIFLTHLALAILPHLIFFINYSAVDKETMFLPVYATWAVFTAFGFSALIEFAERLELGAAWRVVYLSGLLLIPLLLLWANWTYVDLSDATRFAEIGQSRLTEAEPDSIYMARWGEAAVLQYLQIVEKERPDVTVINTSFISIAASIEFVDQAHANGQAVYATSIDKYLASHFEFKDIGLGYRVQSR